MANVAASVEALLELKDVTEEDANLIRKIWKCKSRDGLWAILEEEESHALKGTVTWVNACHSVPAMRETKRKAVDEVLRTHGVEYMGAYKGRGGLHGHSVYYCNAGDTYAPTIIFIGGTLRVGCWGDLVERGLIDREGEDA